MKTIKILIMSSILVSNLLAVSIKFSDNAQKDIKTIVQQKQKLIDTINSYNRNNDIGNKNKILQISKSTIKKQFPSASIDKNNVFIYKKKKDYKTKGIDRDQKIEIPKQIALIFLNDNFSYLVDKNEEFKVLVVGEEYGADQEKDKNGRIKSEVNLKTYSYLVRIGRKVLNLPVFNSTGSIEIDALTEKIISYDLRNWSPVSIADIDFLTEKLSEKEIKKIVEKRLSEKQEIETKHLVVNGVMLGWIVDLETKQLIPAIMHNSEPKFDNINAPSHDKKSKLSYVDRLDGKEEILKQSIGISKSIKSDKPKVENIKNDKPIETQGVKDYENKISLEKLNKK